jgi:hypothetical protein
MAPIQATERIVREPVAASDKEWRAVQAAALGDYDTLASRPWSELRSVELFPGCRLDAPFLLAPAAWVPHGTLRRDGIRGLDPSKAGVPEDEEVAAKRDEAVRRALLALWLPQAPNGTILEPKLSTWIRSSGCLMRLARWQFDHCTSSDGSVFGGITLRAPPDEFLPYLGSQ